MQIDTMLRVINITNEATLLQDVDSAVRTIESLDPSVCGLDTETTVVKYKSNARHDQKASILQLCFRGLHGVVPGGIASPGVSTIVHEKIKEDYTVWIFPLKRLYDQLGSLPPSLLRLLLRPTLAKVSVAILNDYDTLKRSYGVPLASCLPLEVVGLSLGIRETSLRDLAVRFTGYDKGEVVLGNYDQILTDAQIKYAAIDAYLSLATYERMVDVFGFVKTKKMPMLAPEEIDSIYRHILDRTTLFMSKKAIGFNKFYNVLSNGYADWKKNYHAPEMQDLVVQFLNEMVKRGNLVRLIREDENIDTIKDPTNAHYVVPEGDKSTLMKNRISQITLQSIGATGINQNELLKLIDHRMPQESHSTEVTRFAEYGGIVDELVSAGVLVKKQSKGKTTYHLNK